ncbi:hypothetical protein [Streptomyces akebiae]|uniref:Uncharacterized protein n=1 Tax=Streptomyces akebiae TaxID=2865673 RepID=A0ABX8XJN8_9ACTN|nr:hypothetical protein [Streptomyces akebiae]QYX75838.1 hypothetical protein K1J60_04290 [Streptomyces akebiae]
MRGTVRTVVTCVSGSDLRPHRGAEPVDEPHPMGHGATIGKLVDRPQGGPLLELDALTYERLEPLPPRSTSIRLAWLKESLSGQYLFQPYEQLAAAYRVLGHDGEARGVLRAKHRHHRSTLP